MQNSRPLKVSFPTTNFLKSVGIIDPNNVESVYDYYLLENLNATLVKDSMSSSSGYEGVLAESWKHPTSNVWQFKLRPNLKWSDGSILSPQFIIDTLKHRSRDPSRHTLCMRYLKSARLEENDLITLEFEHTIGDTLLHELSLADQSFWHPDSKKDRWTKTSGPFAIKKIDEAKKSIVLIKNEFYPNQFKKSPSEVLLVGPLNPSLANTAFSENNYDLIIALSKLDRPVVKSVKKNAPNIFTGVPSTTRFISVKYPSELKQSQRKSFAALIRATNRHLFSQLLAESPSAQYDEQIIPPGYSGRIEKIQTNKSSAPDFNKFNLLIEFEDDSDELKEKIEIIKKSLLPNFAGIYHTQDTTTIPNKNTLNVPTFHLTFQMFRGNQRDSLGTWAFLSSKDGPLAQYRKEIEPYLEKAIGQNFDERQETLTQLHQKVLDEGWIIPFAVEGSEAYHSKRISLDRWSRFDMRFRYYDIEML